ncbi:hypothetical protein [Pyruvatibacter sp.]|uniref:hypothetical protein n=1 Tax=Pyruvatibacter sp. TaxID=1981328 RepID=UPI0032EACD99
MRLLKSAALAALLTGAGAVAAFANVGAGLVGNSVTLTGPDGAVVMLHYPDASSVERQLPDGTTSSGTWTVNGQDICTTFEGEPEACVTVTEEAPAVGASGEIPGEAGVSTWAVTEGKAF